MDTKRLIAAIALSMLVLLAYQYFFVKPAAEKQQPVAAEPATAQEESRQPAKKTQDRLDFNTMMTREETPAVEEETEIQPVEANLAETAEKRFTIDTSLYKAAFTNKGAGLTSFVLKKYKDDKKNGLDLVSDKSSQGNIYPFYFSPFEKNPILAYLNQQLFACPAQMEIKLSGKDTTRLIFEYADKEKNISAKKVFTFTDGSYVIDTHFLLIQDGKQIADLPVVFGPDLESNVAEDRLQMQNLKIAGYNGDKLKDLVFSRKKPTPSTDLPGFKTDRGSLGTGFYWAAYETSYFATILRTEPKNELNYYILEDVKTKNRFQFMITTSPNLAYLGPKDETILNEINGTFLNVNQVIEYGWFGVIAKILLKGLQLIHKAIPNYGWAIIFLTLILKIILFPLTYSSSTSMAKMQTLQPKIKAIKKKYKNQRDMEQRRQMNVEIMNLYKLEKINPAGGCLPMLLQLPLLFGFWRLLSVSIVLRHQPWMLWIQDLSKKDPYYILPILMVITQFIIQKMTPSGGDDTQKKIMYIMPVFIGFIFMNLASGLNLYFAFSNVLQIGQQKIINDKIYKQKKEEEREKKTLKKKGRI